MQIKFLGLTFSVDYIWNKRTPLLGRPWLYFTSCLATRRMSLSLSLDTEVDRSVHYAQYWGSKEIYGKSSDFTPFGIKYHKGFDRDDREVNDGVPVERGKYGHPVKVFTFLLYPLKLDFFWVGFPIPYTEENIRKFGAA